ncbi:E3 ubiquitin-protein ligase MGRN1 [Ctenocephalides felis]|uniref:E3 ubiquitin-protein ligase MGRN1 n=1 Tax=Ctenocephalides felis TaxID=7515 RepID=UPI000E6E3F65|nr:E3 ubiquitin-protein ligase MGRN1 [Ctenocephalides felis]
MGSLTSRQNAGVEEVDISTNHAYKYPPRTGNYFGSHFIMGGERFDTPQPEAYLFGENTDLNFLGCKPTPFPYPPPQANEPTKTLKSLVNIRKESLKFVRAPENLSKPDEHDGIKPSRFNIEFIFDADAKCAITIYYFCVEDFGLNGVTYTSQDVSLNSETYHYKRGSSQQFSQPLHVFEPSKYSDDELSYNADREIMPIVIHCLAEEGGDEPRQSHSTIAVVEKHSDGTYVLKALKQKLFVDGLCYLLQEIYGIENKNNDSNKSGDSEDTEDNGSECVICMCDVRDTLILPCRHLCLCNGCADSLRYQANNCPICRAPFRALLQIRALRRAGSAGIPAPQPLPQPVEGSCENIPAGYEHVSLIEALNGPSCMPRSQIIVSNQAIDIDSPDTEVQTQAAEVLNRSNLERTNNMRYTNPRGTENKENRQNNTSHNAPEIRMSVLLSREDQNIKESTSTQSPLLNPNGHKTKPAPKSRDVLRHVNEKIKLQEKVDQENLDNQDTQDTDSESEKLSPLLDAATMTSAEIIPLHMDGVIESIDDTDTDLDEVENSKSANVDKNKLLTRSNRQVLVDGDTAVLAAGEDSDYYTPEDPQTTILSPIFLDKNKSMEHLSVNRQGTPPPHQSNPCQAAISADSTPQRWNPSLRQHDHHQQLSSTPGTPQSNNSHASIRSSNDSYSSSSSTRHLLSAVPTVVSIASSGNNVADQAPAVEI